MELSEQNGGAQPASAPKNKAKPIKQLPTDRLSFEKQLSVLRAYGAASGADRKAVSIAEVGSILSDIATTSVSLCNQFFVDIGLLAREGNKFRPAASVIEYLHAFEWNPETAAHKLRAELDATWFSKALQPKLSFRTLTRDEAVSYLAEEAKAPKDCRKQLEVLIDYLDVTGAVKADSTSVAKPAKSEDLGNAQKGRETPPPNDLKRGRNEDENDGAMERFVLPIPGKAAAVFKVPSDLSVADWKMLKVMLETYILRMKGHDPDEDSEKQSPSAEGGASG